MGSTPARLCTSGKQNLQVWTVPAFEGILFTLGQQVTHPYPRHWHEEIHFCAHTAGFAYLGYRGNSHRVVQGDFIVTPPGEVHENWVDGSATGISFRSAYVDLPLFRKFAEQITGRDCSIPHLRDFFLRDEIVRREFLSMHCSIERGESLLQQEELLLTFLQSFLAKCPGDSLLRTRPGRERAAVRKAREYIDENFAKAISLANLGELTSLSSYHLSRMFCQETGMPPHAYQTQVRINWAKKLLRQRQRQALSSVAVSTGFADQSHLTRHFRRLVGVTPGQFLY